jgi:3-methylcrotonyl-CoA carboxylase alpha subunit
VRIDSGVVEGDTVTIFYDPMIAKLIVWDVDRAAALARLREALADCDVVGPKSNVDFLERLLRHPRVVEGNIDTGFLDRHLDQVLPPPTSPAPQLLAAAAAGCLLDEEARTRDAARASADPYSPWAFADGWRLGHAGLRLLRLGWQDQALALRAHGAGGSYRIEQAPDKLAPDELGPGKQAQAASADAVHVEDASLSTGAGGIGWLTAKIDGEAMRLRCRVDAKRVLVHDGERRLVLSRLPAFETGDSQGAGRGDRLTAPMPGRVVLLRVAVGDVVAEGQELGVMEAMKMELSLKSPRAGTVAELRAAAGDFVEADALLVRLQ